MQQWHYQQQRPGDTTREPIQGEFFATEAITNSAEALVREGIQNSLDARRNGHAVKVRIHLSGPEVVVPAEDLAPFLKEGWPHLQAPRNGLREPPSPDSSCPYLTFEDFGTTGLEGEPAQWHKVAGQKNGFFAFFRAEGYSDKAELDRGRWGVGKTVFPRASRISTFWGLTVRASDGGKGLLMGRAILKSHQLGDQRFVPDGYFGVRQESGLTLPVGDEEVLSRFCEMFGLERRTEPGLSIVVPWYDAEGITPTALLEAVVRGYFVPILSGDLAVVIVDPDGTPHELSADRLLPAVREVGGQLAADMVPLIELAAWGRQAIGQSRFTTLNRPPETGALRWDEALMPAGQLPGLRTSLEAGQRIAIRVPLPVREKGRPLVWSFFDVYLVRDGTDDRARPVFVREGIIVSDVRSPLTRNTRALVVVDDKPLATLLGDSENPAHTQWQKDGSNYKGKYTYGEANIRFVVNSVHEIVRLISGANQEADRSLLVDLFSLPAAPGDPDAVRTRGRAPTPEPDGPVQPPPPVNPPEPRLRSYRVSRIRGGFTVSAGDGPPPDALEIRAAYDVRRGSALGKWNRADFLFVRAPIRIEEDEGVEIVEHADNRIVVQVTAPEFRLSVTGFDENRDLYVRVRETEVATDADTQA
jgi:hypothetical protein